MSGPTSAWSLHQLGQFAPDDISKAIASEGDSDLAVRILDACVADLDTLVVVATSGAPVDANILERLVYRIRIAAIMTSAKKEGAQ